MDLAATVDSDLGNFLGRPVRIAEYNWAVGGGFFHRFNPWQLFLDNARVREKTANFELFRSKLHVKMVVSGTGFHYGRALVSYNPLYGRDEVTTQRAFLQSDLVAASQKPHFFINPTTNAGGQLDLPFFYPDNYLSLTRGSDIDEMGEVTIKSFDSLRHANGGTGNVTVTVYAWASDVVLAMPTSINLASPLFTPQSGKMNSGDEYGKGIISKPATAIARAAGHLTSVPAIAPYARATQMTAMAIGDVATHWGYSRPAIVSDIVKFKPNPTGNMANTDAAEALSRLTLDSKQEITIDSRTVGLDGEDQMDVARFCQRESYLDTFTMDETQNPDTLLWNSKVTPVLFRTEGSPSASTELHPTPMAMMSVPFERWQGSIKFRFQIVKSNFHKGRLLVRWDPRSHGSVIEYNTAYSRVVDLGEEDDFEICIGWGQKEPFLDLSEMSSLFFNPPYTSTARYPSDNNSQFNGVLEIAVLNSLVSPAISSPISINVFVSACDDIKFGQPAGEKLSQFSLFREVVARSTAFTPQSGEISDGLAIAGTSEGATDVPVGADSIAPIAKTTEVADQTMNVFFGESVSSLRQLFRRYIKHKSFVTLPTTIPGDISQTIIEDPGLGVWPGWDSFGKDVVNAKACTISIPTFAQFFMPCYAGWRGSTRAKYAFGGRPGNNPIVTRGSNTPSKVKIIINETSEAELDKTLTFLQGSRSSAGSATTNIGVNDTIEVEFPYYQRSRFTTARQPRADFCNGAKGGRIEMLTNAEADIGAVVHAWKSVGEDFTLFFFTGCPILYFNRITP